MPEEPPSILPAGHHHPAVAQPEAGLAGVGGVHPVGLGVELQGRAGGRHRLRRRRRTARLDSATRQVGSSERRAAITAPADPPPTTMKSNVSAHESDRTRDRERSPGVARYRTLSPCRVSTSSSCSSSRPDSSSLAAGRFHRCYIGASGPLWCVNQRSACSTGRASLVSAMDGSSRSTTASSSPMTISSRRSNSFRRSHPNGKAPRVRPHRRHRCRGPACSTPRSSNPTTRSAARRC